MTNQKGKAGKAGKGDVIKLQRLRKALVETGEWGRPRACRRTVCVLRTCGFSRSPLVVDVGECN